MKNFALLALMATFAHAQDDGEKPVEPDNSAFPDEWSNDTCQAEPVDDIKSLSSARIQQCKNTVTDRNIEEVAQYSEELAVAYKRALVDPRWGPRRAYCKMQYNPAYPTSYPFGFFQLWQFSPSSNLFLWGFMRQLPHPSPSRHGFAIHEYTWNRKDCCSAGRQLQTSSQTHKWPTNPFGHTGQLWPLLENSGNAFTFQGPPNVGPLPKPSLHGAGNINYKTLVVYEDGDDYGSGGTWHSWEYGSGGQRVACCQIRPYYIDWYQYKRASADVAVHHAKDGGRRQLAAEYGEDVDVFTPDQFRELFGHEPEQFAFEMEEFNQN